MVKVMHAVKLSKATLAHQDNEHCKDCNNDQIYSY